MSQEEDLFAYDEDDAVRYILNVLPQELKEKYTHDDIIYVTDVVYDYYDQKGLFDEQAGEEVELDEEDIIAFACKNRIYIIGGRYMFFPGRCFFTEYFSESCE